MAEDNVILYVMVVGFHHKKGCQLEYSYPVFPLQKNKDSEGAVTKQNDGPELDLPEPWKHLPSLSLPDGAHRYQTDTIYFHLPSLDDNNRTVFGVSCYRQINADKLLVKDSDVTRETVQKSVCVISRLPLYGLIEAKLALITHAYFEELDFSKVQLLEDTFNQLNESLSERLLSESQIFVGLSVRDLVFRFKYRILVLFKLLLLERKVLFYTSPVKLLTSSIISLLSLFPEMIEYGLTESACFCHTEFLQTDDHNVPQGLPSPVLDDKPQLFISEMNLLDEINSELAMSDDSTDFSKSHLAIASDSEEEVNEKPPSSKATGNSAVASDTILLTRTYPVKPSLLKKDDYGFPLEIFTKGYVCHPYLSLAYYDLVNDSSIPGFVVGSTNVLFFHHHRKFADVLIDVTEGKVEIYDPSLRRQLNLTTEDLRFADYVVKMVTNEPTKSDVFQGTGWEGGEEWVRSQFRTYIMALFGSASRCSALDKTQKTILESYNYEFIAAWRKTKNFRILNENLPKNADEFTIGHPFSGEYNMLDLKTKVNSLITPERAKKINAAVTAVNETGKVVAQATKSWGGTVSSWISGLRKET